MVDERKRPEDEIKKLLIPFEIISKADGPGAPGFEEGVLDEILALSRAAKSGANLAVEISTPVWIYPVWI